MLTSLDGCAHAILGKLYLRIFLKILTRKLRPNFLKTTCLAFPPDLINIPDLHSLLFSKKSVVHLTVLSQLMTCIPTVTTAVERTEFGGVTESSLPKAELCYVY